MTERQKRTYITIANELGYSKDVVRKLKESRTTVEAENILIDARKKGDYRNGTKVFTNN